MDVDLSSDEPQQCEDLWFEDGTIVLQAENTLFRVYTGILARHSPFFKNLFTLPQPEVIERYDDCPLVKLAEDNAQDAHDFLLALHDIDAPDSLMTDAFSIVALLELSAKYEANSLRHKVLKTLVPYFPSTLEAYDILTDKHKNDKSFIYPFKTIPEIVALAVALEKAAPSLLPYALLKLERCSSDETAGPIIDGVQARGRHIVLSPKLQRALLQGKPALYRQSRETVLPRLFMQSGCFGDCDTQRWLYLTKHTKPDGFLDPLPKRTFKRFCLECRMSLERDAEEGRRATWNQLPATFGLASWQELERATIEG
ncbi:hypothetical protein PsYK624_068430 [Phanerochaete sordida]|uniref:BTB domain-containing protein n=1 Tax=Phanerochaete sordida TaxID=48140 RepID=A0A9P3LDL8_9APHY|nr:hypothetical protein PsYK624_068430 [Phanerochaete sordida]